MMDAMSISSLRMIPTRGESCMNFPDFFCIGPQRTGSTWLHANLVKHPEILMHRDKETFFLTTLGKPSSPRYRYPYLEDYLESFRDDFVERIFKNYHAFRRCGRLYSPKITGESTASYCVLPEEVLLDVRDLRPDLKVIMLLRHPVERAWSHAKKDLVRDTGRPASVGDFIEFCSHPDQLARADYSAIISRWKTVLQAGRMFLAPSERITSDPEGLIEDVLRFLGVSYLRAPSRRHIVTRQNPTDGSAIPKDVRLALEKLMASEIRSFEELCSRVGKSLVY